MLKDYFMKSKFLSKLLNDDASLRFPQARIVNYAIYYAQYFK